VSYAPARGRYKVYIIDEVHMLTTAAFNALLKTLEEPPEHVVFVLCTTDPQKIPATILSRVQRFDFHAIANDEMQARLAYVCENEGFTYDEAALEIVARHARGGLRDALSSLEQLSVFGDGSITLAVAQDLLGEVPGSALANVANAMASRDVATLFGEVATLVDGGRDLLQFTRELAAHMRNVYVVAAVGARPGVVSASQDELAALGQEAQAFGSVDRVARILTILADASAQMRVATNQRLVLEVALTRISRPQADVTLDSLAERVAALERQVALLSQPGARGAVPAAVAAPSEAPAAEAPVQVAVPQTAPAPVPRPAPQPAPVPQPAPRPVPRPAPQPAPQPARQPRATAPSAPAAPQRSAAISDGGELQRRWKQVIDTLVKTAASRGSLLMSSTIVSDDGNQLQVSLPKGSGFALRMLERGDVRQTIDPVVNQVFGPRHVVFSETSGRAQAPVPAAPRPARQAAPAPSPAPRPAAPQGPAPQAAPAPSFRASVPPSAPQAVPQPAPRPMQPAASQRPAPPRAGARPAAPAPHASPAAQARPAYSAPWEASAPQPPAAPPAYEPAPYDEVPYDDVAATSYDEDVQMDGLPPVSASAPAARQRPAPTSRPAPQPASPTRPAAPRAAPAPSAAPAPAPKPVPQPAPQPAAPVVSEPAKAAPRGFPDDVPADLTAILEDAFEVFGDGITVSTFHTPTAEEDVDLGDDSAEEDAYDADGSYVSEDDADSDE
jgi:DNA polymerase-3 subunit gamma/tau